MLCQCGCGTPVRKKWVHGHNSRKAWTWVEQDRGYETPCWIWDRPERGQGYGGVHVDGRQLAAHRAVYEKTRGPIPPGLELDHLCRVRACVNPDHLEPVTRRENVRRSNAPAGINARKTHCKNGHAFTVENTRIRPSGHRTCRICHKAYHATYYRANKEKWTAT